jgi:hypothetical protein
VDHVGAGGLNADHGPAHHLVVDAEQARLLSCASGESNSNLPLSGSDSSVPFLAGGLDGQVSLGNVELLNSRRNDGTAMPTRIGTGISVGPPQRVVRGLGDRISLALNFTPPRRGRQHEQRDQRDRTSRKLWNQTMFSITGRRPAAA